MFDTCRAKTYVSCFFTFTWRGRFFPHAVDSRLNRAFYHTFFTLETFSVLKSTAYVIGCVLVLEFLTRPAKAGFRAQYVVLALTS